jgi:hypothetical protein
MCAHYRQFPEDYYRETPIDGGMYIIDTGDGSRLVASNRLKRFRRIAEKGSRRIVDFMLQRIRKSADELADERARNLGVSRTELTTPPGQMLEEFAHAERRLIKSIKRGTIEGDLPLMAIPDVAGLKMIIVEQEYPRLLDSIHATGSCEVVEAEEHYGDYTAINLRVAHRLPWEALVDNPPTGHALRTFVYRGFDADSIADTYRDFLSTAEDTVYLEIIVSTFQDFLESEIGKSMHEERILYQRSHQDYNGHMATNIRYLMDYILNLCRAPGLPVIEEVPIKLWVKYMPDYMEHLLRELFGSGEVFLEMFTDATGHVPPDLTAA